MSAIKTPISLAFAPPLVAVTLFILLICSKMTGVGPSNNTYALCALATTGLGLLAGIIGLVQQKRMSIWWRLLIGVSYLPIVVVSLLLSGF